MQNQQRVQCIENTENMDYQGIPWPSIQYRIFQRQNRHKINLYQQFPTRPLSKLDCLNKKFEVYKDILEPFRVERYHKVKIVNLSHHQLRHNLACSFLPNTIFYTDSQNLYMYNYHDRVNSNILLPQNLNPAGISIMGNQCVIPGIKSNLYLLNLINGLGQCFQINDVDCVTNQALLYSKKHQYDQHRLSTSEMVQINDIQLIICDNNKNIESRKPTFQYEHDSYVNRLAHSPDKNLLALASDSEFISILDYQNKINVLKLIGHTDYSFAVAFNPNKPEELVTGNQDTTAIVWDIRNPKTPVVQIKSEYFAVYHLSYTNDGKNLIVGEALDTLSFYETSNNYRQFQVIGYFGQLNGVAQDFYSDKIFAGIFIRDYEGMFEIVPTQSEKSLINNLIL